MQQYILKGSQSWDTLPPTAKSVLEPIAKKCPSIAGPAVDKARAILYHYTGKRYHNVCESYTSPKKQQKRLKNTEKVVNETDKIAVYPNPTKDQLTVDLKLEKQQVVIFKVFDLKGRLLLKEMVSKNKSTVSLKGIVPGVYLYRLQNEKGELLKIDKLIIQ